MIYLNRVSLLSLKNCPVPKEASKMLYILAILVFVSAFPSSHFLARRIRRIILAHAWLGHAQIKRQNYSLLHVIAHQKYWVPESNSVHDPDMKGCGPIGKLSVRAFSSKTAPWPTTSALQQTRLHPTLHQLLLQKLGARRIILIAVFWMFANFFVLVRPVA